MKIVHLCTLSPYNDYWGYQDNILPKFHAKAGNNVTVITTNMMHNDKGEIVETECNDYKLNDGQRIIRLKYIKIFTDRIGRAVKYYDYYKLLREIRPDFIMIHGLANFSNIQVARYIKRDKKDCIVIADNHLDYNIGRIENRFKSCVYYTVMKLLNKYMQKFYSKVYGVTPWRKEFCEEKLGISPKKTDVLLMGADDDKIDYERKDEIRENIRELHNIKEDEFLIVTGGKIDKNKNIDLLMEAVKKSENQKLRLIVFGSCSRDFADVINTLAEDDRIDFIGWIQSDKVYDYFFAADLVFFPGQHSVLWEQACASGVPLVVKHYPGMEHVNVSGNCRFLYDDSAEAIRKIIKELSEDENAYSDMLMNAKKSREVFLYSNIAKKSLECYQKR